MSVFDVGEGDRQLTAQRPHFVPTPHLEENAIWGNCYLNHDAYYAASNVKFLIRVGSCVAWIVE